MNEPKLPSRVTALETALKSLRNHLAKIDADIEAVRQEYAANKQRSRTDAKNVTAPRVGLVEGAPNNLPNSKSDTKETPWLKGLQITGVVGGILVAISSVAQWWQLGENFRAEQRAWVSIEYGWPEKFDFYIPPKAQSAGVAVSAANVGKSVVKVLYGQGVFEIVEADKGPSLSFLNKPNRSALATSPLFPTKALPFPVELYDQSTRQPRPLTDQEIKGMQSGKMYFAVFGFVEYEDQFGIHWTRYCNWHSYASPDVGRVRMASGTCFSFNESGDGWDTLNIEGLQKPNDKNGVHESLKHLFSAFTGGNTALQNSN